MKKKRVVVTGLGLISPVGNTVNEFWKALIEGQSGVARLSCFDPSNFSSQIAAEVKNFDPSKHFDSKEVRRTDRFVQFAIIASQKAMDDSGLNLDNEDTCRIGVYIGSGIGGLHTIESEHEKFLKRGEIKGPAKISPFLIPMLIVNMASGKVSMRFKIKGPNSAVVTACASGNHAIGDAFRIIQRDEADIMIAGGAEGCITKMGFGGFCALRALSSRNNEPEKASCPFDKNRDGFVMGEGAGIVVLEELKHALNRKAKIYGEVLGYAMSADAYHMTAPDPKGEGAEKCMSLAIKDAGIKCDQVDYINAHGTSTLYNDKIETLAIKNTFGAHARKLAISSTKSVTGHLLGAAGGVEFIACILAMRDSIIPPTINYETPDPECDLNYTPNKHERREVNISLSNSLGFGGHNASLILGKYK